MFGYVVPNKPEMKFKDFDVYRSFYCGLCRELKKKYGITGQLTLTYDLTFVILILSGLYEPETIRKEIRCGLHPMHKQTIRQNDATAYAADMNVLLSYYKCMDDWRDEKKLGKLVYARLLKGRGAHWMEGYAQKCDVIIARLQELTAMENAGEEDLDKVAGCFGRIMEEIFVYKQDCWEPTLRRMGFYLGKFIYLLDAYDDVEADAKSGSYNLFVKKYQDREFEMDVRRILKMMMAEAGREFEKLPIIEYGDIIRNILYSGVWCRFEAVSRQRREVREKEHV